LAYPQVQIDENGVEKTMFAAFNGKITPSVDSEGWISLAHDGRYYIADKDGDSL
jgi:hypothetical protein